MAEYLAIAGRNVRDLTATSLLRLSGGRRSGVGNVFAPVTDKSDTGRVPRLRAQAHRGVLSLTM